MYAATTTHRPTGDELVNVAMTQNGGPYRWGGRTPPGLDCSGLVIWSCRQLGITAAPNSATQRVWVKSVPVTEGIATRGALLFHPGHVAISRGDGTTIEALDTAHGILVGKATTGRFSAAGLVPGLAYDGTATTGPDLGGINPAASGSSTSSSAYLSNPLAGVGRLLDGHLWLRVGMVLGGASLFALGVLRIAGDRVNLDAVVGKVASGATGGAIPPGAVDLGAEGD